MPGLGSIAAGRVMTQDGVDDIAAHTSPGIAGSASYPIIQAACGYFNSSANNWYLGGISRSGSGGGENCGTRLEGTTGIGYFFRVNFGPTINPIVTTGAGTNSGLLICLIAQSLSATNHRLYANGLMTTDSTDAGPLAGTYDKLALGGAAGGLNGGLLWSGFGFREAFTDNEALLLSANPALFWGLFTQRRLWIGAAAVANPLTGTLGQFDPELRIAAWF